MISQYATKHRILVSDSEVDARYLQIVASYNKRNSITGGGDGEFLSKIQEMYKETKSDYLLTVKEDILREKVQASVKMPLAKWLNAQKQSAKINIM